MSKTKQLWALLKFLLGTNPPLFFMPLALALPVFIRYVSGSQGHDYHPSLDIALMNQNMFLVGFIGILVLAPEIWQWRTSASTLPSGTEFLITRALDRHLVYRAKSMYYFLLILLIPMFSFSAALKNPRLQLNEYNEVTHQLILDKIPGSAPIPAEKNYKSGLINIPNGNQLVEGWRLWTYLCIALATQVFIACVYPLKYRRYLLWGVYLIVILLPIMGTLALISTHKSLSSNATLFFFLVAHQKLCWLLTLAAFVLGQLWCERRFSGFEQ